MTAPEPTGELRETIAREVSEWETFVAGDGHRAIRMRDFRTPEQIADALLSGPLAPLLAKLRAVEALADRWERAGIDDQWCAEQIRRALDAS